MLQIKKLLPVFCMLFISVSLFAMPGGGGGIGTPTTPPVPCAANPAAGNTCATATPICDLNGYCGSTAASYTADYWPELNSAFCGSIENNSFLIFTASATSMTFNVWLTSSQTGDGIQIMVFSAAGNCSGAVTRYVCWSPGTGTAGPTAVTATGLTPGNNYYIMIDGFAGDVANYVIGISSGAVLPVNVASSIGGGSTICLGESATLTAGGGNGTYTWDAGSGMSATTGQSIVVTPPSEGTFTYTVHSVSGSTLCPSTNQATTTVQVVNCICSITASNTGNICPGGTSGISATTVPNATGYSWIGPGGYTSSQQNPGVITPPSTPGTYEYIVTATVPNGTCASTTNIIVYGPPDPNLPADMTVCNQAAVPLTTLTSTPAGSTFAWTNSNPAIGLPASGTGDIPAFTATNNTGGVTTATITVTPTINGCPGNPDSYTITVSPPPVMDVVTPVTVCAGALTNAVAFNSTLPGVTYEWTNSNASIGLAANGTGNLPAFTAVNPGASPITAVVTVTPYLGTCAGPSTTFNITVNMLPAIDAGAARTVCAQTSVTLNGTGGASYTWDNGVTDNVPFTATATTTYHVTGTDANGCQNTDDVTITVNPIPTANAGADQTICIGASVTLTGNSTSPFVWNNNINDGVSFSPTSTTTYTLTATDANNCQNTDQVTVTVNPLPNINAGADQKICDQNPITLSGSGGVSYVWTNGVINGQPFQPAIGVNNYTVTGTDANGCINTDAITITVLALPVADFTADNVQGYPTLNVNFSNLSANSNGYVWNFGDGTPAFGTTGATAFHAFPNVGIYNVNLIASNGTCMDETSIVITVLPFPDPILHIPNVFTPNGDNSNDVFWIDVEFGATIEVQIFNRWGNIMHEMNNFNDRWDGKVNGNEASEGVYFHKYTIVDLNGKTIQGHGSLTLKR